VTPMSDGSVAIRLQSYFSRAVTARSGSDRSHSVARIGEHMKERFEGDNRPNLIDALKRQEFVGGDTAIAEAMAAQGELLELQRAKK
jgi:hypothetical protein